MTAITEMSAVAAIVLAAVFAMAGLLKLRARDETEAEFAALGLRPAGPLARIVPPLELAVAAALVVAPTAGGPAAATMLGAFTAVLVRVVRSGRSVACGCLGGLDRRPVSGRTIARNLGLLALAATVTAGAAADGWRFGLHLPLPETAVAVGAAAVVATLTAQLLVLRRSLGRLWSVELAGESSATAGDSTAPASATASAPTLDLTPEAAAETATNPPSEVLAT